MNKLFLICPDCYIEQAIRKSYGEDCFFMTALGSVFEIFNADFWVDIDQLIQRENIKEVYVVNDTSCRFIESGLTEEKPKFNTDAEKYLIELNSSLQEKQPGNNTLEKLCDLNIKNSVNSWLRNSDIMKNRVNSKDLSVKGLVFDRKSQAFKTINVVS